MTDLDALLESDFITLPDRLIHKLHAARVKAWSLYKTLPIVSDERERQRGIAIGIGRALKIVTDSCRPCRRVASHLSQEHRHAKRRRVGA